MRYYSEMTSLMERVIHKYTQWEDKKERMEQIYLCLKLRSAPSLPSAVIQTLISPPWQNISVLQKELLPK